jgi:hypothetical protein
MRKIKSDYSDKCMIKIKFEKPRGQRIKTKFYAIECLQIGYWYDCDTKKWEIVDKFEGKTLSSVEYCRTVKAFAKKLKTLPKDVEFRLYSKWVGYDVIGINK